MPQQDAAAARYKVLVDGDEHGPYPASVLSDWIAAGTITEETKISTDGGKWVPAKEWIRQAAREATSRQSAVPEDRATTNGKAARHSGRESATAAAVTPPQPSLPRDRIVVIGRRQSGKTIFLASIYARLWRSLHGMTAKAISGTVHKQLMDTYNTLQRGRWPAATLDTLQIEMEIDHAGRKRQMVTLDFAGEMFRKAFVEEQANFPGVRQLTEHIDRAAAVLLLIDPSVVAGDDRDAAMDDDFGIVQVSQRIRRQPDGADVPIVLVLTKADQNQGLIDRFGGTRGFVRHHFPALVRTLKELPLFQVSAVQTDRSPDGTYHPRPDSEPVNVEAPLQYCLDYIDRFNNQVAAEAEELERAAHEAREEREEAARDSRTNRTVAIVVGGILAVGLILIVLVVIKS